MAESPYIIEGEVILRELETRVFSVVWDDFTTGSTGGVEAYVNGSTDSANLLSGTSGVVGNTQTLPTLTVPAGYGGVTVVLEPGFRSNSQLYKTGIVVRVLKPGAAG